MKVVVVGTGYVGLVTGACLADVGHTVVCVDRDPGRAGVINEGKAPFFEPELDALIARAVERGLLSGTTDLAAALPGAEVSIIAVGTPSVDGRIDLSQVESAGREIGGLLASVGSHHTVVLKSTCVPGTTDTLLRGALEAASGWSAGDFGLCMNPEFLREGSAVADFRDSDRVVIGAWDDRSAEAMERLYAPFDCPKLRTSPRNAEMIKYTSNGLLATLISFSNEIAGLCESVPGLDERVVMEGLHLDRRLTPVVDGKRVRPGILSYLRAGIGYGGSCFPKDTLALRAFARGEGAPTPILDAVIGVNDARADRIIGLLETALPDPAGSRVAVLGLAFKPDTDDVRESPGLRLAAALARRGAAVVGWDPVAAEPARRAAGDAFPVTTDLAGALAGADAAVIATAWPELAAADWAGLIAAMRRPLILDGRDVLERTPLPDGAVVLRIGRRPQKG